MKPVTFLNAVDWPALIKEHETKSYFASVHNSQSILKAFITDFSTDLLHESTNSSGLKSTLVLQLCAKYDTEYDFHMASIQQSIRVVNHASMKKGRYEWSNIFPPIQQ